MLIQTTVYPINREKPKCGTAYVPVFMTDYNVFKHQKTPKPSSRQGMPGTRAQGCAHSDYSVSNKSRCESAYVSVFMTNYDVFKHPKTLKPSSRHGLPGSRAQGCAHSYYSVSNKPRKIRSGYISIAIHGN